MIYETIRKKQSFWIPVTGIFTIPSDVGIGNIHNDNTSCLENSISAAICARVALPDRTTGYAAWRHNNPMEPHCMERIAMKNERVLEGLQIH